MTDLSCCVFVRLSNVDDKISGVETLAELVECQIVF